MLAQAARFSTYELNDEQRSSRWEEWNRSALVGLNCHTPHGRGLRGEEVTLDLGELTLGHVQAERHHISRTAQTVDTSPTRSMVVYAILHGRTTFADSGGSWVVSAGDAVIVDADRPFERTFATSFAELAIKVPWQHAQEARSLDQRSGARCVRTSGLAALRVRTLGRHVVRSVQPAAFDGETLNRVALDLVNDLTISEGVGDRLAVGHMLIEQHLGDPTLSAPKLAGALEISERQLSRLFAETLSTFPKYLTERRLSRAAALLATPARLAISDIAAQCGFSSSAYFSRVFRDRFDVSPQQFRARRAECEQLAPPA